MNETEKDRQFAEIESLYRMMTGMPANNTPSASEQPRQLVRLEARVAELEANFARLFTMMGGLEQRVCGGEYPKPADGAQQS
jgi:hypothetical protein